MTSSREGVRIAHNVGWLFFEKAVVLAAGVLITAWVARYLGPEAFGILSYALALTSMVAVVAALGLDQVIMRDVVRTPQRAGSILASAFALRLMAGIVAYGVIAALSSFQTFVSDGARQVILITGVGAVILSVDVLRPWFHSQVASRFVVWAQLGALISAAAFKVGLILSGAGIVLFAAAVVLEALLYTAFLYLFFSRTRAPSLSLVPARAVAKVLLVQGWPLLFAGVANIINFRVDQVMLGIMSTEAEVGLYAVAVKLSEAWYFVPTAVATSVFPYIVARYAVGGLGRMSSIHLLSAVLLWGGLISAVLMTVAAGPLVSVLFGSDYATSAVIVRLYVWSSVAVFFGSAWGKWILVEGRQSVLTVNHVSAAVLNVLLNLLLIPQYGAVGSAVATVASYTVSQTIGLSIYKPREAWGILFSSLRYGPVKPFRRLAIILSR